MGEVFLPVGLLLLGAVLSFTGGLYAKRLESRRTARIEMLRRIPQTISAVHGALADLSDQDPMAILRTEVEQLDRLGVISGFRDHVRTDGLLERLHEIDLIYELYDDPDADPLLTIVNVENELTALVDDLHQFDHYLSNLMLRPSIRAWALTTREGWSTTTQKLNPRFRWRRRQMRKKMRDEFEDDGRS